MTRKPIEFMSNNHRLVGFIDYPDKLPAPGVIAFHGGTNNKEACPCFPEIPEALVGAGYIVMRFDFFGSGESDGEFKDKTNAEMLQNMKDAIDFFAKDRNMTKFGIFARSQSGIQQSCLYDERIVCRVVQSPAIVIKAPLAFWYPAEFANFQKQSDSDYLCIENGDVRKVNGPYCYSRKYIEEEDEVRRLAQKTLPRIKNVLIMQGNKDKEVEPRHSREIYDMMQEPKEYHIIDGAGHPYKGYEDQVIALAIPWFNRFLK